VVWECSVDLASYVLTTASLGMRREGDGGNIGKGYKETESLRSILRNSTTTSSSLSVMEFGVGHGVPLMSVAKVLSDTTEAGEWEKIRLEGLDYNTETIVEKTWGNIMVNFPSTHHPSFLLYSGSWSNLPPTLKYDLLLFSETCYNEETTGDTVRLCRKHLKKEGVGVVAGKDFYFGVGGGVNMVRSMLQNDDGLEIVEGEGWKWDNGNGNVRSVVVVRWRKGNHEG